MNWTLSQKCQQHYREAVGKCCTDIAGPFPEASQTLHRRRYRRKFMWKKPTICRRHFRRRNFATTTMSTCSTTPLRRTTTTRSPASTRLTTADSFFVTAATRCLILHNTFILVKKFFLLSLLFSFFVPSSGLSLPSSFQVKPVFKHPHPRTMARIMSPRCSPLDQGLPLYTFKLLV